MQQDRPEIQPNEILIIRKVEEDFHVIVDIHGSLYRAHFMIANDNPSDQPLRIDDTLLVTQKPVGDGQMTHVERVTPQGERDGCRFAFSKYQAAPQPK